MRFVGRTALAAVVFALVAWEGSVDAQLGQWRWQNPRPQGNPLYAVRFSDERRGLGGGGGGQEGEEHDPTEPDLALPATVFPYPSRFRTSTGGIDRWNVRITDGVGPVIRA